MELRQIQYFICLFEEGTATRAAKRLNIVQPALSMQIAKLEDEIGQQLFERSTQGMHPTSAGRRMYRLFLPIMRDFLHAREQLLQKEGELSGHVNIGMIASIAHGVLTDALREFTALHPNVNVTVVDGYSAMLADWVTGGRIDAAIINRPRRPLGLNMDYIIDEELGLITSVEANQHLPAEVSLQGTTELSLVLPTRHHGLRGILESFSQAENIDLTPTLETDSVTSIIKLVESTSFASILPRSAVHRRLERGRLQWRSIVSPRLIRQVVCATHPRRPLSPATAVFMATLTSHILALGPLYSKITGK
ncbi:LysR family transcriptional regulator [Paracandidimonas soli]|uniref:LysR family transcriptional regulator n=1 Tax=Paracandidimonas soli TaxID=1917182 RepID=A0A4R3V6I0_9BURK|nr:LysR family transcriptional regulator [Paracandidimonas soli]TCU99023.1 LysR family transcriptional regulator [Paracandidimonas soli]